MRPSKSRSRNKSNRNRSIGNVVNRVFDSSGPEGKVRGTPQQIIDKYNQLARDAQLSGDRVATENFQQHAEHYQRMLNEATREQEMRREEHERQNRDRQTDRDRDRGQGGPQDRPDPAQAPQPDVFAPVADDDSGLVETPESRSVPPGEASSAPHGPREPGSAPPKSASKPRSRKPSKSSSKSGNGDGAEAGGPVNPDGPAEAAE